MSGLRPTGRGIPYEAQVFGRMAVFGLLVGGAYWFLTYETAGSVLLFTFGIASAVAAVGIFLGGRRGAAREASAQLSEAPSLDREPVPVPGWAPIVLAVGLGAVALGAAFGPWLSIAGLVVAIVGAWSWLASAMGETDHARGVPRRIDPEG